MKLLINILLFVFLQFGFSFVAFLMGFGSANAKLSDGQILYGVFWVLNIGLSILIAKFKERPSRIRLFITCIILTIFWGIGYWYMMSEI